jgi:hypothetical protein
MKQTRSIIHLECAGNSLVVQKAKEIEKYEWHKVKGRKRPHSIAMEKALKRV